VVDHLLLYAFHLATAIFVLALVLRDPWTRLDRYVDQARQVRGCRTRWQCITDTRYRLHFFLAYACFMILS
jgi:hypothetical protein